MKTSTFIRVLTVILSGVMFASCSKAGQSEGAFDLPALVSKMEQGGWSYLETLGVPGKSEAETMLAAKTSRTVTAFWVTKGVREQKIYQQTDTLYAVIAHQKPEGDTFSVVFKRPKD